ncbi:MAG: hypothetical protein GY777_26040 [Candidatus Brocadiaceae bacterium]|nr:hypothetical protein [Candidatus Brocadiaceae bacterium]
MKKIVTLLMFALLIHSQSVIAATISSEKRALIEELVGQTEGSVLAIGNQLTKDYIQQVTMILQDIEWFTDWKKTVILEEEAKKDVHGILEAYIKLLEKEYRIYDEQFTIEELKQVIELKDTPEIEPGKTSLGKKIINVRHLVNQEIEQYEQAFSETESPHILQRIFIRHGKDEKYIKKGILFEKLVDLTKKSALIKANQLTKDYIQLVTKIIKANDPYVDHRVFVILEEEAKKYVHGTLMKQPVSPYIIQRIYSRLAKETIISNLHLHEIKSDYSRPVDSDTISPEKRALIDKLCEQSRQSAVEIGNKISKALINTMTTSLENTNPNYGPRVFTLMEKEIEEFIYNEVVVNKRVTGKIYQIYDKYFTIEELKQIIELKDTPDIELKETQLGRKFINVRCLGGREIYQAILEFSLITDRNIHSRIHTKLKKEGIK